MIFINCLTADQTIEILYTLYEYLQNMKKMSLLDLLIKE